MSVSARLSKDEKAQLLAEAVGWKTCVEQVVLLLDARQDPQAAQITAALVRWLRDPRYLRKAQGMSLGDLIEAMREQVESED